MEPKRRSFLKNASLLAGTAFLSKPLNVLATASKTANNFSKGNSVVIFHTAALKGCLNNGFGQTGGLEDIHKQIENQEISGLILDAGNFMGRNYSAKVPALMNKIGYHTGTIGTAELKYGLEKFSTLLPQLDFPLVSCNYLFDHPKLKQIPSYTIIYSGKLKIGITGVGPDLPIKGLTVKDPYLTVKTMAKKLKQEEHCDLVICLSALNADQKQHNNKKLASVSEDIDFIIGSAEDKISRNALILNNSLKQDVVLSQPGQQGILLGKASFGFNDAKVRNNFSHQYEIAGLPYRPNTVQSRQIWEKLTLVKTT